MAKTREQIDNLIRTEREEIHRLSAAGYSTREAGDVVGRSRTLVARVLTQDGRRRIGGVTVARKGGGVTVRAKTAADAEIVEMAIRHALAKADITIEEPEAEAAA